MKEIKLTQDRVVSVDDKDFDRLNQFRWCAHCDEQKWYAVRTVWINGKSKTIHMHREIADAPDDIQVDHKNGDGLDNQKQNLRLATNQQNKFNRNVQKNNKLGIKGVRWHKRGKKFCAQIGIGGKSLHLGSFSVLGDADSAYRIAEEKYFGEFARIQ